MIEYGEQQFLLSSNKIKCDAMEPDETGSGVNMEKIPVSEKQPEYLLKLVVCLGNPGSRYDGTRHNLGFAVADALLASAESCTAAEWQPAQGMLFECRWGSTSLLVLKPMTFMNNSGLAVVETLRQLAISPRELLVISDDLDLEPGRLRLRLRGSNGGHRGLGSIANELGTEDFPRLRLGVGRPRSGETTIIDYVLDTWTSDEIATVNAVVKAAADILIKNAGAVVESCSLKVLGTSSDNDNAKNN